ncbi:hypothetical protein B0T24DRAFT_323648 [Lasiosphaeria ovina]|uniref:Uncharacterized protein n=1 Tax=Lasiosphaeria ovina TaxID=92902 RepID=A0AAE0N629_9PEZI|nr:hypothetical protein B0T24DRAFT_323648 [Lasiosphaeria ovina]
MAVFCCCSAPRSSRASTSAPKHHPVLPVPPPPARLPGPLTMNPVTPASPDTSPDSLSSLRASVPMAMIPVEPVELGQLVVEDSDSDEEPNPAAPVRNSSALQLVRTRIRRHLSQDSLSRRKGRSAVGCSQEEIQRRAELKRLMHKRIQEELRSEEGQEPPPSDISSSPAQHGAPLVDHLPGGGPRDNLEFSVSDDSRLNKPCASNDESDARILDAGKISSATDENDRQDCRRASCPESHLQPVGQCFVRERNSLPQMPSSPDLRPRRLPSSRETSSLGSWRLSYSASQLDEFLGYVGDGCVSNDAGSVHGKSTSPPPKQSLSLSQRFSLTGHSLSLSRSHSSPARQGTPGNEKSPTVDQSPLGTWLRSQGLRSRSQSPSLSYIRTSDPGLEQEGSVKEAEVVYIRRWSSVQNCAVAETDISRPEIVHLYDMDISRQLVTRAFNTPADSQSHSGSGRNSPRVVSNGQGNSVEIASQKLAGPVPELGSQYTSLGATNHTPGGLTTNSSSVYPSTTTSVDPVTNTPSVNPSDLANNKVNMPARPELDTEWLDVVENENPPNKPQRHHRAGSSQGTSNSHRQASYTQDELGCPSPSSEVSSKARNENRAETIDKAIGHFRLGHGAPAMIASRFRKESNTAPSPLSLEPAKPSLLARLHLTMPRKAKLVQRTFDGSTSAPEEQPTLSSPLPTNSLVAETQSRSHRRDSETGRPSPLSPSPSGSSDCEDSTAELWQRAIREEAQARGCNVADRRSDSHHRRLSFPGNSRQSQGDATSALKHYSSSPTSYKNLHSSLRAHGDSPAKRAEPPSAHGNKYHPTSVSWSIQTPKSSLSMHQRKGSNTDTAHIQSPRTSESGGSRLSGIPESWARFPSHSRAERNGPAGYVDQVAPTDYMTMAEAPGDNSPGSRTGQPASPAHESSKLHTQSLTGRFGRAVKSGIIKLISGRASPSRESPKDPKSRQRSGNLSRTNLEYPELELLPMEGGYQEIKALEHEIQHMKGAPRLQCPAALQDVAGFDKKVTLSTKMATILHTDGTSESERWRISTPLLLTPGASSADAPRHGGNSSSTTDRFVTPLGSMSISNDNMSFHSYPQSRPLSRSMAFPSETLTETSTSAVSAKSDTTLLQNLRSTSISNTSASTATKFRTWNGRSRSYPLLMADSFDPENMG